MSTNFLTAPIVTLPATAAAGMTLETLNKLRNIARLDLMAAKAALIKANKAGNDSASLSALEAAEVKSDVSFAAFNSAFYNL